MKVTGYPEDLGIFGYVGAFGTITGLVAENITIVSTGYGTSDADDTYNLFGPDIENPYTSTHYFVDGDLIFYNKGDGETFTPSSSLKETSPTYYTINATGKTTNYTDIHEDGSEVIHPIYNGYFLPSYPDVNNDPFSYSWVASNKLIRELEVWDLDGDGKLDKTIAIDMYELQQSGNNAGDFNHSESNASLETRLSLVAYIEIDGYLYSRVIETFVVEFNSNRSSSYEDGLYSVSMRCEYIEGATENYSHGNNIGFLVGHLDGTLEQSYVFNGTFDLNGSDGFTKISCQTQNGLVGQIGKNVLDEVDPEYDDSNTGPTGVMNFTRIYEGIRSNMVANDPIKGGTDSGYKYVSYDSYINDDPEESLFDLYEPYLRHTDTEPAHYITGTSATITGSDWKDYSVPASVPQDHDMIDFLPNNVIQDEDGENRGLGVFKLVTPYNGDAKGQAYGPFKYANWGDCKIVNGHTPITKVYFSTAEFDHDYNGDDWNGWGTDADQIEVLRPSTLPSYPNDVDTDAFAYPFSRDYNYVFELDLSTNTSITGKNYMHNTKSKFLESYLKSILINQWGEPIPYDDTQFGFMFRYSSTQTLTSLTSYMEISKPGAKKNYGTNENPLYYPNNSIVFEIDGASHNEPAQIAKDEQRDKALNEEGIKVVRIKTADIYSETQEFKKTMAEFYYQLHDNETINHYRDALKISAEDLRVQYDAVMRLELAILFCMKNKVINIDAPQLNIKIVNSDVKNLDELLMTAYEDLRLWIENIAQLAKVKIKLPALKIAPPNNKKAIALDFCMFRRYADADANWDAQNTIYVRTDYFCDKDYFRLATAEPIKYKFTAKDELKDNESLKFLLKNLFGHDEFRTGQMPILKNILNRADTIGILPTGTGKSLCYQLPALLQPGVNIVVVPLISLMQDQKRVMESKGITRVSYISSALKGDEKNRIVTEFKAGKYQFMVVSPERLQNAEFREALGEINATLKFSTAVIDEVHCLSEWGHDFRVSYLRLIPTIKKYCPKACLLGLTATASQAVLEDLKAEFGNDGSGIKALQSMDRDELVFHRLTVTSNKERDEEILKLIKENDGVYTANGVEKNAVGLIFCQRVKPTKHKDSPACEIIWSWLCGEAYLSERVEKYHGQLKDDEKAQRQAHFMEKNFSGLMVCTTAFGMGIDKENIKYTIHASLPKSIEAFYQEAGRAGRDKDKSTKAHCYIIHKPETVAAQVIEKIFDKNTSIAERKKLCSKLNSDLGTVMYFLNLDKDPLEDECDKILKILAELEAATSEGDRKVLDFDNEATSYENAKVVFERLQRLGAIESWQAEDTAPNVKSVHVGKIDLLSVKKVSFTNRHQQRILDDLRGGRREFIFSENFSLQVRQMALYKLTLLGIVRDWTIEYDNLKSGRLYVDYAGIDLERVKESLLKYIHKHDVEFSLDGKQTRYTPYYESVAAAPNELSTWLLLLITWTNNEIIYNRLQSAKNMLDYCAEDVSDEVFRQKINDYFKYTEKTVLFDAIVQQPLDYKIWFEVLKGGNAETLLNSLLRYLESYGNNTGLNYLCGILRLSCGEFEGTDGEWRLTDSLQNVKESFSDADRENIINETLALAKTFGEQEKNMLSEKLLGIYPELVAQVHEELEDIYSLSLIIDASTAQIRKILEEKIDGLFKTA